MRFILLFSILLGTAISFLVNYHVENKIWRTPRGRISATSEEDFDKLFVLVRENSIAIQENSIAIQGLIKNSNRTEDQIQQLTGYNQNRDQELEQLFLKFFMDYLETKDWDVLDVQVDDIFHPNGTVYTEWDGVLFAKHPNKNEPTFFFLETKQLFNMKKFNKFKKRLEGLDKILANLDPKLKLADDRYLRVARRLTRFTRQGKFDIAGVLASPNIETALMKRLMNGDYSYLTYADNNYSVKLVESLQAL